MDEKTIARFFEKVDKTGPVPAHCPELGRCWVWTAALFKTGYGAFSLAGKPMKAHRVSWEIHAGPPGSLCVLHRCDNRTCVNPGHLFTGTIADNNADMGAKGRRSQGESHARKLAAFDVLAIRRRLASGEQQADVAADFGVTQSCVSLIAARKIWRHD